MNYFYHIDVFGVHFYTCKGEAQYKYAELKGPFTSFSEAKYSANQEYLKKIEDLKHSLEFYIGEVQKVVDVEESTVAELSLKECL